jgi:hypothetical protein
MVSCYALSRSILLHHGCSLSPEALMGLLLRVGVSCPDNEYASSSVPELTTGEREAGTSIHARPRVRCYQDALRSYLWALSQSSTSLRAMSLARP